MLKLRPYQQQTIDNVDMICDVWYTSNCRGIHIGNVFSFPVIRKTAYLWAKSPLSVLECESVSVYASTAT